MKKLLIFFILIIGFNCGRSQDFSDKIEKTLVESGLENIRVTYLNNVCYLSFENNIYRWNIKAMKYVLDTISQIINPEDTLNIIQLRFDIPQINARVQSGLWQNFIHEQVNKKQIDSSLTISYRTDEAWKEIKRTKPINRAFAKFDFVFYPQFFLSNVTFNKIYEIQLNLAPALEVSFWRGMLFTAQVIFPIVNDYGETGDLIRPGFLVLSQNFKFANSTFVNVSAGNFNYQRYGLNFQVYHHFKNERWYIGLTTGLTGTSQFNKSGWTFGTPNTVTWSLGAGYFLPFYSLRFDLNAGRFLKGDYGVRFDLTRMFGETTIGFYAIYSAFTQLMGGRVNGGFHFSIPFPPRKRWKHRRFRAIPPRYFDWEYNAGTEFRYGRSFETRPNENRSEHYYNPVYFKEELLKIGN